MKLPIVTYKDYQERGGTLSEEAFETSLMHAQSWLRYVLGYNEPLQSMQPMAHRVALERAHPA